MQQFTWIFSLLRSVTPAEKESLQQNFLQFQGQWKTHGTPVNGLIRLHHDRFVVIQAREDDGRPSGCSIDSLRRGVTEILSNHQLPWSDGSEVSYRDGNGEIHLVHFQQIPSLLAAGTLQPDSIVFDHTLKNSDDLSQWERPLKDTWLKRFLPAHSKQH